MSTTLIEVRPAKAADAVAIASAHDEAWRAAYQGIMYSSVVLTAGTHNVSVTYAAAGQIQGAPESEPDIYRTTQMFGTVLDASLPGATGEWGYVTGLQLKLGREFTSHGKERSFLSAGCPAPRGFPGALFPLVRTSFAFAGGKTLTATLTRSCRVKRR